MDLGIAMMLGSDGLTPPELGRAVEDRGLESLFFAEHTHIPVASRRADGQPVRSYADTYDPFVALAAVAAVTTEIKIGTGVCLVTERDPIITAKEVASLDRLSGGRFLFGVGAAASAHPGGRERPRHGGPGPGFRRRVAAAMRAAR